MMQPAELQQLLGSDGEYALLDVREAGEAEAGHIPGATFLPRRLLEFRIDELVADRGTHIVVYDEGGTRARYAQDTLTKLSYTNVEILEGGLAAWSAFGGDVVEGANVPSKIFGERVYVESGVPQITADDLAALLDRDEAIVCDIRLLSEHENARVPGAWYAPNFDIALLAHDLAETGKIVVCHCAGRTRSIVGAQTLREFGVKNAHALKDGTMGWVLSGRELEKGPMRKEMQPTPESIAAASRVADAMMQEHQLCWSDLETLSAHLRGRSTGTSNAYMFDVRQLEAFADGHIPGVVVLPGGQAVLRADDFIAVRNAPIFLVDNGTVRAAITARWLSQLGYTKVYVVRDAYRNWQTMGGPLATGRGRQPPLGLDRARACATGISAAALSALLETRDDVVLIDVDNSKNFEKAHVPGAAWVQRGWLEDRLPSLCSDKSATIAVTCANGLQSIFAAAALHELGFGGARYLDGGNQAWKVAGLPLETGLPAEWNGAVPDRVLPPYARGKEGMVRYLSWEKELASSEKRSGLFAAECGQDK